MMQKTYLWRDPTIQQVILEVDSREESEITVAGWYLAVQTKRFKVKYCDARCVLLATGDTRPSAILKGIVPRGEGFGVVREMVLETEECLEVLTRFITKRGAIE